MGSSLRTYFRILAGGDGIQPRHYLKTFLTGLIILVTLPFRWYERGAFAIRVKKAQMSDPVFILGHWRSGTTYLHNVMCQDPSASYLTTYQSVFPNYLSSKWLFKPFMRSMMPDRRPSDNVKLSPEFPQEDEFALGELSPHSYYNFFYFPGKYRQYFDQAIRFEGLSERERKSFARKYRELLVKAALNTGRGQLVVKNPVNTARLRFLKQEYPAARFIHIVRDPFVVYRSTKKFFTRLIPTLWFHSVAEEEINEMILDVYEKLYRKYLDELDAIRNSPFIEIRFEDFEKDPMAHLERIYDQLDLHGFEHAKPHFESYTQHQRSYQKNKYVFESEEIEVVSSRWGEFIKHWGYAEPTGSSSQGNSH